ncbi:MAG TPA: COX15/CtaA family protein [Cellvibrio sp.]|nr:COX15/CtaA family protein [Cellvibrio sp.]
MSRPVLYFQRLVNIAIVLALLVIALGAYTRLTDAGLGCPDWPGCYGKLTAPLHEGHIAEIQQSFPGVTVEPHKAHNEMLHRYVAGLLGLLVFGILVTSFIIKRWRFLCVVLSVLVILQALLGMWTVTLNLIPLVVMAHLLGGFFLLSLLALLRMEIHADHFPFAPEPELKKYIPFAYGVILILLFQIALGGWTSANYAALVCTQLPVCEAGWQARFSLESIFHLPLGHDTYEYGVLPYEARMSIHITHRLGAVVTSVVLISFLMMCWRNSSTRYMRRLILLLGVILATQVSIGIVNVYLHLPLINAVAHNLVAANLLMLMTLFIHQMHRRTYTNELNTKARLSVAAIGQ